MLNTFRKCLAEFLGTFAIVFVGCGAVAIDDLSGGAITHLGVALCFGLVVMTMIYALGHISGAHFNPAVTVAFSLKRHFPIMEVFHYIFSQCAGAVAASYLLKIMLLPVLSAGQKLNLGVTLPMNDQFMTALLWEIVLTFFLMLVIMAVATDFRAVGQMAGLAIGGVVTFDALFAGVICGASMNPARSFGPALIAGEWSHFWAYVFGPIIGACLAAVFYTFIRCQVSEPKDVKGCC